MTYHVIVKDEVNVKDVVVSETSGDVAVLDTTITPELKAEGEARELMRAIQDLRKQAGYEPHDRVALILQTSDGGQALVEQFKGEIMKTVGATELLFGDATGTDVTTGDHSFTIELKKL